MKLDLNIIKIVRRPDYTMNIATQNYLDFFFMYQSKLVHNVWQFLI